MPIYIAASCDACGQAWAFSNTGGRVSEHKPDNYAHCHKKPEAAADVSLSGHLPKGWEWRGGEPRTCMTLCPKCVEAKREATEQRAELKTKAEQKAKTKPATNPLRVVPGGLWRASETDDEGQPPSSVA